MAHYEHLLQEVTDGIHVITINRPNKLNCLDQQLWMGLQEVLREGDANPDVHVQILTGSGRAFCAGDDISLLTELSDPKVLNDLMLNCIYGLVDTIIHLQKPLIAAVNGIAYGGGCELVLLSDLAIASDKAMFAQPEGLIGAWPMISATFGAYLLGPKAANQLNLVCDPLSAQEALSIGLINKVVPHEKLMESAFEMSRKIMRTSLVSLKIIKETTNRIMGERLYDFWVSQLRALKESSRYEDWAEGASAFLEKRPPQFKGQ